MADGDTKTQQYLDIAANGTRAQLPSNSCCNTRTQDLIVGVAERIMDVEDEVEELKNNPDVADIVATYADLQNYDTSTLTDKDIIRVLADETHDGDSTYYRYSTSSDSFTYIGESKQYTDFVGTDGTAAGTNGLVPAPAATDAGKFLKADGTWDTVNAGPTVVQTTGDSTTDVMSQKAVSSMVFDPDRISQRDAIRIGAYASGWTTGTVAIGYYAHGPNSSTKDDATAIGAHSNAYAKGSVAIGAYSNASQIGEFNIGSSQPNYGYNLSSYRLLTGLYDGQSAHDAATVGQARGETESYTIASGSWSALSSSDPYTFQATVTATHTISASTVAELLNDAPVTFATYGFAIGSISGQSVTIYSIGQPSAGVTLKVNYKG